MPPALEGRVLTPDHREIPYDGFLYIVLFPSHVGNFHNTVGNQPRILPEMVVEFTSLLFSEPAFLFWLIFMGLPEEQSFIPLSSFMIPRKPPTTLW